MDSNPNSPYYSHKNHLKYGNGYGRPLCSRFLDCSNKHSFIFGSSGMFAATNCQATRSFLCFFFQWSMIFGMQTHQQNQRVSWTKKEVFLAKQKWQRADVKRWRTPGQNLKNLKHFKDGFFHEQNWCHLNCRVVSPTGQPEFQRQFSCCFHSGSRGNDRKTCFRAETLHMGVSKNRGFSPQIIHF